MLALLYFKKDTFFKKKHLSIHFNDFIFASFTLVVILFKSLEMSELKNMGYLITDDSKPDKFIDTYGHGYG